MSSELCPDLALNGYPAQLLIRLRAGEILTGRELATIRDNLSELLDKVRARMFENCSEAHRNWVGRQQQFTGEIVSELERAHFAALRKQ